MNNIKTDVTDLEALKPWLKSMLQMGEVVVTFTKKDGTERVMKCTTSTELVPLVEEKVHVTNTDNPIDFPVPKKEKKVNEDVMPVYDLESKAWKSFRWDGIKTVNITIGEENGDTTSAQ